MYGGSGFAPMGLIIAFAVLLGLARFMRWAFSGPGSPERRRRGRPAVPAADDGLLTRIATLSRRESAFALRAVLSDAGIRSTLRPGGRKMTVVLVFPEDADRARALALSFPGHEH